MSLLTAARPASADLVYDWTLSGTDTGSGTLTAGHPTVVASTSPRSPAPSTAIQSMACSAPHLIRGPTIFPLGAFIYDNIVYPGSAPAFDTWGVVFSISGAEGHIWGNSAPHDYSYYECCYAVANDQVDTFTLTQAAVGEPSSLALFGGGFLRLWVVRRHKAA